jgi:capsular polysaccharide transport system permease protein
MADYTPLTRAQTLVGTATDVVDGGRRAGWRLRRLLGSINIWFWAIVGLPTLVAGIYYFAIASDLYLSEARFVVRGSKAIPASGVAAMLQSTGFASSNDDQAVIESFIMSRDAVRKLEQANGLRDLLNRPEGDLVSRFPGIMHRADFEALYQRYAHFVSVETNHTSGVTSLMVKAYRPEDSQVLAGALMNYSEQLVNELNERARRDALDTARREVDRASDRIAQIQGELTAYRVKEKMLDPKSASAGTLALIAQMTTAQTNARQQLDELLKNSPNSPQVPLVKTRIASLDKLIDEEHTKISGESNSVVAALSEYERLETQQQLAEKALASAFVSLEAARLQAQRQQLYLETIAQPNLADYPLYPKRLMSFAMVFAVCFLVYGLAWLMVAHVREHAAA